MKKILAIFFMFLLFSLPVAASAIDELTKQLEESTALIIELAEDNKILTKENSDLQAERDALLETSDDQDLSNLLECVAALEESTDLIFELKERIEEDQVEIERLRKIIRDIIPDIDNFKMVELGIGGTYPWGGKVLIGFNIPSTQVGIFADCAVFSNSGVLQVLVGVGIKFRF